MGKAKRMLKTKLILLTSILLSSFFLVSCGQANQNGKIKKVGLLVEGTVSDQMVGTKGYKGLLMIQSTYNIDVYYKEEITSEAIIERAVKEFKNKGINLIIGNGQLFADYFNEISSKYPSIHFVSFNGQATNSNTTSIVLEGYACGYFAGMVAGHMTTTNTVASLSTLESQSAEVQGFHDGAKHENSRVKVITTNVPDKNNQEEVLHLLDKQLEQKADVIYAAENNYNIAVIERLKEKGLYAIGYMSEQSTLGEFTVLTSTIQYLPEIYAKIAKDFNEGKLLPGNIHVSMKDEFISLGKFSPKIDKAFKHRIYKEMDHYKKTGELPKKKAK
ncbi:MAG: BMP family ABC transporter substrate-binding protein [Bacillus sp. (in: firmicutes)]